MANLTNRVRRGPLTAAVAVGAVISAMGIVENILLGWTDIWPQVFLSTGLTIAMGIVVFVLQRSWAKEVSEEVQQCTEKTGSAIQDIGERTAELEEEIRSHKPISLEEIRDLSSKKQRTSRRIIAMPSIF